MLVQLFPWLTHVFPWHFPKVTPGCSHCDSDKGFAITNQNTTATISLGFLWPSGSFGFNNSSSLSQQSCVLLECLMGCYLKIQMPGCSASLPLRRNLYQVLSSSWAEVVAHFCWYSTQEKFGNCYCWLLPIRLFIFLIHSHLLSYKINRFKSSSVAIVCMDQLSALP